MNILVTGGAGFIGSHLVDYLVKKDHKVVCVDNLLLGSESFIEHHKKNPNFKFIKADLLDKTNLEQIFKAHAFDCVFHMAANSDIQQGAKYVEVDLNHTFMTTFNVLDCMRQYNVKQIIFASSSAVYGELNQSLYEDIGPLFPISLYGAAKLSSEAYISAFCENYGMKSWIIRFPNVVGERTTHGIIFDFIEKLSKNPNELLILGDGKQEKQYLYVKDLVEGMLFIWKNSNNKINYFNIGAEGFVTPIRIAEILVREMDLGDVKFSYSGGDRGWVGDVPKFKFDLSKLNNLGWKVKLNSEEAVKLAIQQILKK